jgi:hypothetical protein
MAKAIDLTNEAFEKPAATPRAAHPTCVKQSLPARDKKAIKEIIVPLQIRVGASVAKNIKRAALEADQNISEFIAACFHAYKKKG